MNKEERKEYAIANCGTEYSLSIDGKTAHRKTKKLFCGYYNDCPNCRQAERVKRASVIKSLLLAYDKVYMQAVAPDDWDRLRKKLNRESVNAIKVPVQNGDFLIVCDKDPGHKEIKFNKIDSFYAIGILTSDEYLFPAGSRSTIGEWSLTKADQQTEEFVVIEFIQPHFKLRTGNQPVPFGILDKLKYSASTWSGGRVTVDNAQDFVSWGDSVMIELAIGLGYDYIPSMSKIKKLKVSVDDIENNWQVVSVDSISRTFFGEGTENDVVKDRVYSAIHGLKPLANRLEELKAVIEEDYEQNKMIETYQEYGDVAFVVFYGKEKLEEVQRYLFSQLPDSQHALDSELPF